MDRQSVRGWAIYVSFALFPVTIYYFSPYLIIQGAGEGVVTGSFITFVLLFFVSLFLGRAYLRLGLPCGWIASPII